MPKSTATRLRKASSTRVKTSDTPKRNGARKKRVSAVQQELSKRRATPTTKRRPRRTRSVSAASDKIVHLAMSMNTANYLRVILNRARLEDDGIEALKKELASQLDGN